MSLSTRATGRLAGAIYTFLVITGIIGLAYIPGRLIELDDPSGTLTTLRNETGLFQLGIAAEFLCYGSFIFLALVLFRLLRQYGEFNALALLALVLASVPISFTKMGHKLAILRMIRGEGSTASLPEETLHLELVRHLEAYSNATWVAYIFWGLWLLPLGLVVVRTGLIPRWLGVFLLLGGLGYLATAFGRVLLPGFLDHPVGARVTLPSSIGEIGTALWLLVMGAREPRAHGKQTSP